LRAERPLGVLESIQYGSFTFVRGLDILEMTTNPLIHTA